MGYPHHLKCIEFIGYGGALSELDMVIHLLENGAAVGKVIVDLRKRDNAWMPTSFLLPNTLTGMESAYHYIKSDRQRNLGFDHGESSNNNTRNEFRAYMESQMAYDEALARALEMYHGFNQMHISHPRPAAADDDTRSNVAETHVEGREGQNDGQDNEELHSLGDAVGHESKGFFKKLISQLPISKYKIGSSKKKEKEKCVICLVEFMKGVEVTTLPCAHYFHPNCINECLEVNKNCPVCQKEVQEK